MARAVHNLLQRQLKRYVHAADISPEWEPFVNAVNEAYHGFDSDRGMLERALELSSHELLESNIHMQAVFHAFPDLFLWIDENDAFMDCQGGGAPESYFGLAQPVGKHIPDIPNTCLKTAFRNAVQQVRTTHTQTQIEYAMGTLFCEVRLLPLPENTMIAIFRDISDRKRVENALRESEHRFKQVAESAGEWIWELDANGVYTYSNPVVEQILGYKPEELIGQIHFYELMAPHVRDEVKKAAAGRASRKEGFGRISNPVIHKDGHTVILETTGVPILNANGELIGYRGTDTDITERKRAEDALRESETFLRETQQVARLGGWKTNPQTDELEWNDGVYNIIEESRDYRPGLTEGIKYYCPEYRPALKEGLETCLTEGKPFTLEAEIITARRNRRWVEVRAFARTDSGGQSMVMGTIQDITERKQTEDALRESEARTRAILSAIPDLMFVFDREGVFQNYHATTPDLLFLPPESFLGKSVRDVLPPSLAEQTLKAIRLAESSKKPQSIEYSLETPLGMRYFEGRITMVNDHQALSMIRDVTARTQAEAERAKLQTQLTHAHKIESVGRLAGGVAHDFNNMLGAILGHTELAMCKLSPDSPLYEHLSEIRKAGERSANLTRQLLAFARKQTITPKVLDLNETVEGMLNMLQRLIGEDIELIWRPGRHLGSVKLDPSQLDQILANLCVNARDAISGGGRITIETGSATLNEDFCAEHEEAKPGDYVRLSVSDTGIGIDEDTLANLFEPFFTTKDVGQGTGLGLSMVYGAVKQNQGIITVHSRPGEGSTFAVYLPQHKPAIVSDLAPEEEDTSVLREQRTILLVEDEPAILNISAQLLAKLGYTVLTAATPESALQQAESYSGTIDLLMTDVVMPNMNGRELANKLRTEDPNLRCLFMSGYTANVIANHGVLEEGVHFIQKPFTLSYLSTSLRNALGDE